MVQVIKRVKVGGKVHEHRMAFSDSEWKTIKKHYPFGGTSFELESKIKKQKDDFNKPGRAADDDKPNMKDYAMLKDRAMTLFKEEQWDKALYYFQAAFKLKGFGWLNGKIAQCIKNAEAENLAKK